eukprot:1186919-Prorocentrum_minimum.AAC.5
MPLHPRRYWRRRTRQTKLSSYRRYFVLTNLPPVEGALEGGGATLRGPAHRGPADRWPQRIGHQRIGRLRPAGEGSAELLQPRVVHLGPQQVRVAAHFVQIGGGDGPPAAESHVRLCR